MSRRYTPRDVELLSKGFLEESFLHKKFPVKVSELKDEERFALSSLVKRKDIIIVNTVKIKSALLTELGKKLISSNLKAINYEDRLTHEMLKTGDWKGKKFRRFERQIQI